MLSRLGEQRYACFWEGWAGEGGAPLPAWMQGHWLTPRPGIPSCGLRALLAIPEGGL